MREGARASESECRENAKALGQPGREGSAWAGQSAGEGPAQRTETGKSLLDPLQDFASTPGEIIDLEQRSDITLPTSLKGHSILSTDYSGNEEGQLGDHCDNSSQRRWGLEPGWQQ